MNGGDNRRSEGQLACLHTLARDKVIGDPLEFVRRPLDKNDFHHMIVLQKNMERADDFINVSSLKRRKVAQQIAFRLIVKKRDRPRHDSPPLIDVVLEQTCGNHLRDGLGSVLKPALADQEIKIAKD